MSGPATPPTWVVLAAALALLAGGCGDDGQATTQDAASDAADAGGDAGIAPCESVAPTACAQDELPFAEVQPIFEERCVPCHDGSGDEWPLTTWRHAADWAMEIRSVMLDCSMPPADADPPVHMTQAERDAILMWLRCGYDP
jgi:hypothetical protein